MFLGFHHPILVVSRQKLVGLGDHWGVQLPDGRVAHCSSGRGVSVTTADDFAQGKDVTILRDVPEHLHGQVMQRLRLALFQQQPYDAANWNCEIFANWLTGEKPESPQVKGWAILILIVLAVRMAI